MRGEIYAHTSSDTLPRSTSMDTKWHSNSRTCRFFRTSLIGTALALVSGCLPTGMPGYSADGRHVAVVASGGPLWLYDVKEGTTTRCPMPDNWELRSAQWIGNQLWVSCK